eukprot:scaffold9510_cov58-Attheya_sp.AAC.5
MDTMCPSSPSRKIFLDNPFVSQNMYLLPWHHPPRLLRRICLPERVLSFEGHFLWLRSITTSFFERLQFGPSLMFEAIGYIDRSFGTKCRVGKQY